MQRLHEITCCDEPSTTTIGRARSRSSGGGKVELEASAVLAPAHESYLMLLITSTTMDRTRAHIQDLEKTLETVLIVAEDDIGSRLLGKKDK